MAYFNRCLITTVEVAGVIKSFELPEEAHSPNLLEDPTIPSALRTRLW